MAMQHLPADAAAVYLFLRTRPEEVPSKLTMAGVVACAAAVRAAATSTPAEWGVLVGTFFGGLGCIGAGLWVEADVPRRATAGKIFLCCAVLLLRIAGNLLGIANDLAAILDSVLGAIN